MAEMFQEAITDKEPAGEVALEDLWELVEVEEEVMEVAEVVVEIMEVVMILIRVLIGSETVCQGSQE